MKKEIRFCTELRAESQGDDLALVGYAAVFNTESKDLGGFKESITPGTFTRSIAQAANVACLFNHDANVVLGRVGNGTLTLTQDARGLAYRCVINRDDPQAISTYAKVKRGDVSECSFGFTVPKGGDVWEDRQLPGTKGNRVEDFYVLRTLRDVNLLDVSPVVYPAYGGTNVDARMFEDAAEVRGMVTVKLGEIALRLEQRGLLRRTAAQIDAFHRAQAAQIAALIKNEN
jgi:HK97 family phage prohead protease